MSLQDVICVNASGDESPSRRTEFLGRQGRGKQGGRSMKHGEAAVQDSDLSRMGTGMSNVSAGTSTNGESAGPPSAARFSRAPSVSSRLSRPLTQALPE